VCLWKCVMHNTFHTSCGKQRRWMRSVRRYRSLLFLTFSSCSTPLFTRSVTFWMLKLSGPQSFPVTGTDPRGARGQNQRHNCTALHCHVTIRDTIRGFYSRIGIVQYGTVRFNEVQYHKVQYINTVLYSTVQYSRAIPGQ